MPADQGKVDISFAGRFTASAIAACFAEVCTIPLDTAKVRLQLQKNVVGDAAPKYRGLLGTAATIAREEGAAALWKGIVPGLHRQCIYGGLRIGLYEPVKSRMMGDSAYKSTIDCFVKTLKNDGPLAFYKGFLPNFARLGSWNVIMFLTLEQVQKFFVRKPAS
ncbi:unnamed protein product [Urochloa humidicola]